MGWAQPVATVDERPKALNGPIDGDVVEAAAAAARSALAVGRGVKTGKSRSANGSGVTGARWTARGRAPGVVGVLLGRGRSPLLRSARSTGRSTSGRSAGSGPKRLTPSRTSPCSHERHFNRVG
jgi:hypothetical protein